MNCLKKLRALSVPIRLANEQINWRKNGCRPLSGSVHRISEVFLTPGQQSIKWLNEMDKGNAKVPLDHPELLFLAFSRSSFDLLQFSFAFISPIFPSTATLQDKAGLQTWIRLLFADAVPLQIICETSQSDRAAHGQHRRTASATAQSLSAGSAQAKRTTGRAQERTVYAEWSRWKGALLGTGKFDCSLQITLFNENLLNCKPFFKSPTPSDPRRAGHIYRSVCSSKRQTNASSALPDRLQISKRNPTTIRPAEGEPVPHERPLFVRSGSTVGISNVREGLPELRGSVQLSGPKFCQR